MVLTMSDYSHAHQFNRYLIQGISNPLDKAMMLQEITQIFVKEFPTDFCLIVAGIDDLNNCKFSSFFVDKLLTLSPRLISELIANPWIKDIVKNNKIRSISELKNNINLTQLFLLDDLKLKALLATNTNFQNKVNGLILLGKNEIYHWNQQDEKLLKEAADIVAIACYLTQLSTDEALSYRSSSFSLSDLSQLLEKNTVLRRWWETKERQLESSKQQIFNMITIMSDQTRNPLATIKMVLTLLRNQAVSSEERQKRLDIIENAWQKLNDINEKTLKFKNLNLPTFTLSPNPIHLSILIKEIITYYQHRWQTDERRALTLQADLSQFNPTIEEIDTDAEQLKAILQELLTNAEKFAVNDSTVWLKITEKIISNESKIVISISNLSPCNFTQNVNQFFEPFYREQKVIDTAIPGIGLGLTNVKKLVELLNGTIEIVCDACDTPECCKITVKLMLPQSLSSI